MVEQYVFWRMYCRPLTLYRGKSAASEVLNLNETHFNI